MIGIYLILSNIHLIFFACLIKKFKAQIKFKNLWMNANGEDCIGGRYETCF